MLSTGVKRRFSLSIRDPFQSASAFQIPAREGMWRTAGPNNWATKKIHLCKQGCTSSSVTTASSKKTPNTRTPNKTPKPPKKQKKNPTTTKNEQKNPTGNSWTGSERFSYSLQQVPHPDTSLLGTSFLLGCLFMNPEVSHSWLCSPTLSQLIFLKRRNNFQAKKSQCKILLG